ANADSSRARRALHGRAWQGGRISTAPPPSPAPQPKPRFRVSWQMLAFIAALLVINFWFGSRATQGPERVRVPYSPYFLTQVQDGNVADITSKGTAIQGTFKKKQSYQDSKATTQFKTEVPAFADTDALSQLLEHKKVVINAKPLT